MKIIFMGTPAFAVPTLAALLKEHDVLAVCTQPDRPAGRGNKTVFSPVKETAVHNGINVLQPETLFIKKGSPNEEKAREIRDRLKSYGADIFVVAAYGLILPKAVLEMPPLGCVNVHASLLPKYRGSSPIHQAILNGDDKTGVTIMYMDDGIDTGDMILQKEMPVACDELFLSVQNRMAELGGTTITEALHVIENGTATRTKQDDSLATHAPMINKTDGLIDWNTPSIAIVNKVRAYNPWPGAYTVHEGNPLKIWRMQVVEESFDITNDANVVNIAKPPHTKPGTVIDVNKHGLTVSCADGKVLITELQGPNGKKMPAGDYLRGRMIQAGTVF
jgi:methionyl-tRNA formyltransferase